MYKCAMCKLPCFARVDNGYGGICPMRAGLTCDCDIDGAQIGRGQWESGHRETSQHSAQPRQCRSASLLWEATGLCSIKCPVLAVVL